MAFTLQLKRHVNYENKGAALAGLKAYLAKAAVGEPAIATYGGGETIDPEKVLFGIKGAEDYTIFDYEAIPADVQAALDAIKGKGYDEDGTYATLKAIADALTIINGADTVEGSIAKAKKDAKDYADEKVAALDFTDAAVAGQFVDSVSETDGVVSVTRKPITSNDKSVVLNTANGVDLSVNIDGTTILRDGETGKLSVASAALVQYVGADAIKVSEVQDGNKTISLAINTNDKVLTQNADGLLTNINLTWDKTAGLKLIGKGGTEIAVIPAADFIKDGMLENVELKAASVEEPVGEETEGTFLVFTFNTDTGSRVINLDVTSLIDVYTAGNGLQLDSKAFSVKLDAANEAFLTVGAGGIKLSGVQAAIDAAVEAEETARTNADKTLQDAIDKVEAAAGIQNDGTYAAPTGTNYLESATSLMDADKKLDAQVKVNTDAISAETTRAKAEETRITDTVIGEDQLEEGKSVMDVILENEETTQQAIEKLATSAGLLNGEEIAYTAPTVSGEFSSTTSIMDMLNVIDEKWNTIDCGTY